MGFRDVEPNLAGGDREALRRAPSPYFDHFQDLQGGLLRWNDNPLIYVIDRDNPLKEPSSEEARLVSLVNSYLYVCTFALNAPGPGGLQIYTNGADWALYFHPVDDPKFFALGERRLYGALHSGGHQWTRSAFTQPVECNRFELSTVDRTLVEAVTALHQGGKAQGYLFPVRTFMVGTSDNHLWGREQDLPLIWGASEQVIESDQFQWCSTAQQEVDRASQALKVPREHWVCFVRAVMGAPSAAEYVWSGHFRPGPRGGPGSINHARNSGIVFSTLERALDELNFARNRMVHDGFVPPTDWQIMSLAHLGSRFWIIAFKRILAWEGVRKWTDKDACEALGLQALAKESRASLQDGHKAYERAIEECRREITKRQMLDVWQHLSGEQQP